MRADEVDHQAYIAYQKALAGALLALEEGAPEERTATNFLFWIDTFLSDLPGAPVDNAQAIFERARAIRNDLDTALRGAKRAKSRFEPLI